MPEVTEAYDFHARILVDQAGDRIGKVEELYQDRESGRAEWALVHSGLFGMKKTFVPLRGAQPAGEDVRLPIEKGHVKGAPHVDPDAELSEGEEQRLFEHYGVPYTTEGATGGTSATGAAGATSERVEPAETRRPRLSRLVVKGVVPQERAVPDTAAEAPAGERPAPDRDVGR